ncbi:putative SIK1-involved in pre-rRNA processing [Ceraceosorus guamensis]|uniref:Nucleolar protein 56 n=1 Tax=Ceraceosorus guamensis TaxID=1522189 RepID=A0A316W7S0_9BASI|nr:putative SIK1-involved in pre-rRNA processing [Ceraceosorus guamensis]PWN44771.1 putative SIK1-involved in pre-rRNA processing [Ceraceosorus guamensis]
MSSTPTHILFECATGCAILQVLQVEEIGSNTKAVQESVKDIHNFSRMVKLISFSPFKNALDALQSCLDVSEGVLNEHLKSLLTLNLAPAGKKAKGVTLGVAERGLAGAIVSELGIQCDTGDRSQELVRGIRLHAEKLLSGLSEGDMDRAQLGLGHSYSRSKVKFNVNRSDNMIIQAIALLDTLDKDVNTFAMRVREWYGWHFPELVRLVSDNMIYAKLASFIRSKERLSEDHLEELAEILDGDDTAARNVLDASRASMGTEISEVDMDNIDSFAERVVELAAYRKRMHAYLVEKMHLVAPNLSALIGEVIGARLISHAGSLTNLAKYPASTVQILGAEKALFRALKTKGNTPKYGLIYHASAIARAAPKNKGRMSRFLANKISIASRIDCFSDAPSTKFGEVMHHQVEERLVFYETGKPGLGKNSDAMSKALKAIEEAAGDLMDEDDDSDDEDAAVTEPQTMPAAVGVTDPADKKSSKKDKKEKKDKKDKKSKSSDKASKKVDVEKAAKKAAKEAKKAAKAEKVEKKSKKSKA